MLFKRNITVTLLRKIVVSKFGYFSTEKIKKSNITEELNQSNCIFVNRNNNP